MPTPKNSAGTFRALTVRMLQWEPGTGDCAFNIDCDATVAGETFQFEARLVAALDGDSSGGGGTAADTVDVRMDTTIRIKKGETVALHCTYSESSSYRTYDWSVSSGSGVIPIGAAGRDCNVTGLSAGTAKLSMAYRYTYAGSNVPNKTPEISVRSSGASIPLSLHERTSSKTRAVASPCTIGKPTPTILRSPGGMVRHKTAGGGPALAGGACPPALAARYANTRGRITGRNGGVPARACRAIREYARAHYREEWGRTRPRMPRDTRIREGALPGGTGAYPPALAARYANT